MDNLIQDERKTSIKRRVLIFSAVLFSAILVSGCMVFIFFMQKTVQLNIGHELVGTIEFESLKLESSVNGEIALALKMATSPIIIQHFINPDNSELKRYAFMEIAGYRDSFKSKGAFWVSDKNREFYFDEENHYTVNPDDPDSYWYNMTLHKTEKYNFNINYNAEMKKIMLWINAPVFDSNREPIGIVGTGIDLSEFVESIYRNYRSKSNLFLFNSDGEITGARKAALVTDKVTIQKELGHLGTDIFDRASKMSDEAISFGTPTGEVAIGKVPALNWYMTAIQKISIADIIGSPMTFLFLAMMAVIAGIFIVFYMFITGMISPMNKMMKVLDQIAVDWDLTRRLDLHRRDEIGMLGEFLNMTFEKMRELLLSIKGKTVSLTDTGDELSAYMITTKKDIEGINNNIQFMRGQILTQSDKVISASGSMEKINADIDDLNKHITLQAESVAQSSSAIEEMLANINSVTQTLVKNTANINTLANTSGAGRADLTKVSTDIQEIAKESEALLQINSVMQTIASQTNLLAMNAAIEAAHAGESGRGFAVVADEIRKLAENSGNQSKTISAVLKKIKNMIDDITRSTSVVLERFDAIEREVKTVSDQEAQIRNAMEEQGEGSRQILDAISQLNTVTSKVRKASSNMTSEGREVLIQSDALKQITAEVAGNMDDMSNNADEITNAFSRVQEITYENKDNIMTLNTDMARFKVG